MAPRIDDRDWSALTTGQRIRQLEVEGYLVLPDLLDADHIARLKAITATFETTRPQPSITANASAAATTSNSTAAKSPPCSATRRRSRFCANFWATK